MTIINIPLSTNPYGKTTYTAQSGDVFNIPARMVGDIVINGATDFTVNILGSLTGRGTDNLNNIQFGDNSVVTLNIPAGVDTSPYAIDANGKSLIMNIGAGATVGDIDASHLDATGTFTVNAGDNVRVDGYMKNLGPADASITFGENARFTGNVQGSAGGSAEMTFGNGATFGGSLYGATGSNPDQTSSITLGDNVSITGTLVSNHLYGDRTVEIGDNLVLNNALNLAGGNSISSPAAAFLTIGDNATVKGNITGTESADKFVIGDNWDLRNINMLLGNDTVNIGFQNPNTIIAAGIDGGNPNGDGSSYGSDFDQISIALRPDQISDFQSWGWVSNGDGTWSPPGRAFNGSPAYSGNLRINDFEGAAAPVLGTLTITPAPGAPIDQATGNPLTAENGAPAQIIITRSGPTDEALVVTLTDGDPSETNAPTTVTIPAGATSIAVEIPSVDDTIVDGDQISTITATAPGFATTSQNVTVADDDVAPNQIVDGENSGEIMNPGYNDNNAPTNSGGDIIDGADGVNDVILGNGGNDTINAGQGVDEVYGGSGNDTINGGAGNDILVGDFAKNVKDVVVDNGTENGDDVINGGAGDDVIYGDSNDAPTEIGTRTFDFGAGRTQTFGGVTASWQPDDIGGDDGVSFPVYIGELPDSYTGGASRTENAWRSSLDNNGQGSQSHRWDFGGQDVAGFAVVIGGIQTGETVNISGFNAAGELVTATVVAGSALTLNSSSSGSFGVTNNEPFGAGIQNPATTFTYMADEPLTWVQITHFGDNSVWISPAYFGAGVDEVPTDGIGGDDVIEGGLGADQMFGEGGDDTFLVGSAEEGAGDEIVGGNGPNQATDNDILDLRGAGPVSIVDTADTTDEGARTGTVTFGNGATLQFSQIETILQDAPVLTITPAPGTPLDPNGNPETIENGQPVNIVITRTGPTDQSLTVTLTSNDPTEATVPQTVTIPAGQSSVTVPVTPVDDPLVDGTQFPVITATAPGFAPVQETVAVKDDDFTSNKIIDGENSGEIMNPGYNDNNAPTNSGGDIIDGADGVNDVILGNGGNDTINAGLGNDTVYGGSGNDIINGGAGNDILVGDFAKNVKDVVVDNGTVNGDDVINGGAGDDVIYGDSNEDLTGEASFTGPRESFNWDLLTSTQADTSVVQDTGDVKVTYTRTADTGKHESDVDNATRLNTTGIDSGNEVIDTNSSLESVTNGNGNKGAFQWQFDKPVGNVEFNVNDLDGSGVVTIKAYSPDGTETEVQLVGGANIDTSGNVAWNNGGGYQETNDADVSVQVTIPGPVSRIELVHDQRGDLNSGINVTDMYFDTGFVPGNNGQNGVGGDDVINGGEGNDIIYGDNGTTVNGQDATPVTLNFNNRGAETANSVIYNNVAKLNDGTNINAKLTLIGKSDPNLLVDLSYDANAPVLLNGNNRSDSNGDTATFKLEFFDQNGNPVALNSSLVVGDVDGRDIGEKATFSLDEISGYGTNTGSNIAVSTTGNTVTGTGTEPTDSDAFDPDDRFAVTFNNQDSLTFTLTSGATNSGFNFPAIDKSAFNITPVAQPALDGGNDVITGGAGADKMFGEGGDDTFIVASAAEGAGDEIVGGNGPNQATDNDILDLRGAGPVSIVDTADTTDAGARTGTVTFGNGATLQFSQIETILQDAPVLTITPAPGTPLDPNGNPETIENGQPVNIVITRTGPTDQSLTVTLTSNDPTEATVPQTVTIPAGQTSVTVPVTPVDDPLVDGTQFPVITATAPGFAPVQETVAVKDDDVAPTTITITPAPGTPVDDEGRPVTTENGAPAKIVVSLDAPALVDTVVTLTNGDPSEINPPLTVTIPAGQTSVVVDVPSVDDPDVDGTQIAPITASAPGLTSDTIEVAVRDDDVPTLTITPAPGTPVDGNGNPETSENGDPVTLVITRTGPTDEPLVVTLSTNDPSEITGPQTVIIPAGQDSVTFDVTPVDDPLVDGTQFPVITATAPGFTPVEETVAVKDDDVPPTTITITPAPGTPVDDEGRPVTTENGAPAQIVVSLDAPALVDTVVTLTNGDPSEINPPLTVTIPAGQTSVVVDVPSVDDPIVDGTQIAPITASAPGLTSDTIEVAVRDDDVPTLTITPAPGTPVDDNGNPVTSENGDPVDVVITRNGPLDEELVVTLGSNDPTEATVPQTVIIPAGQASVTVPVTPVDDPDVDGDQTPIITATAPGFEPVSQPVVVLDDDVANRNPDAKDDNLGQFTVDTPAPIDVAKVLSNDSDPDGDPLTITGVVGTTNGRFDFVDGVPSFIPEPGFVGTASLTYGVSDGKGGTDTATIFFEFVDKPVLTITPAPGTPTDPNGNPVTSENGQPVNVVITRSGPTDQPLTVTLSSNDPTEASVPQTVIIPAGQSSVTIPVVPVDDADIDGTQYPTITVSAPNFVPFTQTVAVQDDDVPVLTITPGSGTQVDADGNLITAENGQPVDIVITRSGPLDEPCTITLTSSDQTEATVPTTVTIPAGVASITVPVTPVDDNEVDGPQLVTITVSAPGVESVAIKAVVNDDDVANRNPDAVDDQIGVGQTGPIVISPATLLLNDSDPDGDAIRPISIQDAQNGTVVFDGTNVIFTPTAGYVGPASFKYTITDDKGGVDTATVNLVVDGRVTPDAPNTAPDMTAPTDTGISDTDDLTKDTTPDFKIVDPGENTPNLYVNGEKVEATFDSNTNILTPVAPLPEGPLDIAYTLTNPEGKESGFSPTLPIVIDVTPPATPINPPDMTPETDSGISNIDDITNINKPEFAVDSVDNETPILFVDGKEVASIFNPDANTLIPVEPLDEGPHQISYKLVDDAGNETPLSEPLAILIDTTAPDIGGPVDMTPETDTGISDSDDFTGESKPDFAIEPVGENTPTLYVDGLKVASTFDPDENTLTPVEPLEEGVHAISYTLTDPAGNESVQSVPLNIEVNFTQTQVPDAPIIAPDMTPETDTGVSNSDDITGDTTPSFTIVDPGVNTPVLYVNGQEVPSTYDSDAKTLTPINPFPGGVGEVTYTFKSPTGQESAKSPGLSILITTPKNLPAPDMLDESDTGVSNTDDITSDTKPAFETTPITGDQSINLYVDGVKVETVRTANGGYAPVEPISEGPHEIYYTVVDHYYFGPFAGQSVESNPSPVLPIVIDLTAPEAPQFAPDMTPETDTGNRNDDDDTGDRTPSFKIGEIDDNTPVLYIDGQEVPSVYDSVTKTLTPVNPLDDGPHEVTYTLKDPAGNESGPSPSLPIVIRDQSFNQNPDAVDDTIGAQSGVITISPATLLGNDSDPDGDTISGVSLQDPVNGTVTFDGVNVIFTPTVGYKGPASFTYTISDGKGGFDTATVNLTVDGTVTPVPPAAPTVAPDMTPETDTGISNTDDITGDTTPSFTLGELGGNTPNLYVDGVKVPSTFQFGVLTPVDPIAKGPHTVTYTVTSPDGLESGQSPALPIEITVTPLNQNPDAVDDTIGPQSGVITISPATLLGNDSDPDGDTISGVSLQNPVNGTVVFDGVNVIFTPTAGYTGPASFTYTISDGKGGFDTATVNLTVQASPTNPPAGQNHDADAKWDTIGGTQSGPLVINPAELLRNDKDEDGDTFKLVSVQDGVNGTVTYENGMVIFTPNPGYSGPASFTYTITDGKGGWQDVATVNLNVAATATTNGNYATVIGDDGLYVVEHQGLLEIKADTILSNDVDVEGDSFSITNLASNDGTVQLVNGVIQFTPNANVFGDASVQYTVTDSVGNTSQGLIHVSVLQAGDSLNVQQAQAGQGDLFGTAANDMLLGDAQDNVLNGGAGDDTIIGGAGDDIISGGAGNDVLTGGVGADTFSWSLSDTQGPGVEVDVVKDFDQNGGSDVINLKDLLVGESQNAESLANYLHFDREYNSDYSEVTGTRVYISSEGKLTGDHAVGHTDDAIISNTTQQIFFEGVDLTAGATSDLHVIQNLLSQNKLITD